MLWWLAVAALVGSPPTITLSSPATVRIGDEFELHVSATWQPPVTRVVPALEQWVGPFEIVRVDAGQPSPIDGSARQTWIVHLRTFDRGHLTIPGMPFDYQETGTAEHHRAVARSVDLEVGAPVVEEKETIRPLKPPIEPRRTPIDQALIASEIGLVALFAGWVVWWMRLLLQARRGAHAMRRFDRASAVRQLVSSFPTTTDEYEPFYATVSTLTRQSLENAFEIPATVLSSTEIGTALGNHPAADALTQTLTRTLTFVDIVRFGGRQPTAEENHVVLEHTKSLLLGRA